jgi:hypothetical protein
LVIISQKNVFVNSFFEKILYILLKLYFTNKEYTS